jgi:T4-like virus tail tube protein gp19
MPAAAQSYATGHSALELNGVHAGFLNAAKGGEAYGDVIEETVGPDLVVRKHIAGVRYSDIEIACGAGMTNDAYTWIADMLAHKVPRKSGAVVALDYAGTERRRLAFTHALITEVGFPALDAASKDAAHIAVKITPEQTQRAPGSGARTSVSLAKGTQKQKQWLRSNFRLTIDGLDCTRVNRIESLVVRQGVAEGPVGEQRTYVQEPSAIDIGDLVVTVAESHAQDWYAWHHDFVVQGNQGPPFERNGKLQFLAPNLQDVVFELAFKGLGIHRLAAERQREAAAQEISQVRASMYCEELTFAIPAGSTSGTATATATSGNGSAPPPSGGESTAPPPPSRVEAVVGLVQLEPERLLPAREGASRIRPI